MQAQYGAAEKRLGEEGFRLAEAAGRAGRQLADLRAKYRRLQRVETTKLAKVRACPASLCRTYDCWSMAAETQLLRAVVQTRCSSVTCGAQLASCGGLTGFSMRGWPMYEATTP